MRSLDEIEHGIIREDFNEPRIHFALVCAALSCPKLRREAYVAEHLQSQLQEQVETFLADPKKGLDIDLRRKRIAVSSILQWFAEDFPAPANFKGQLAGKPEQAGVVYFLQQHAPSEEARTALASPAFAVRYLKYDWALNGQK